MQDCSENYNIKGGSTIRQRMHFDAQFRVFAQLFAWRKHYYLIAGSIYLSSKLNYLQHVNFDPVRIIPCFHALSLNHKVGSS